MALLLDEPTNHLDLDSIHWLQSFLNHYERNPDRDLARPGTFSTAYVPTSPTSITRPYHLTGSYDEMVLDQTQVRSQIEAQNSQREKKIAQLNDFIAAFFPRHPFQPGAIRAAKRWNGSRSPSLQNPISASVPQVRAEAPFGQTHPRVGSRQ